MPKPEPNEDKGCEPRIDKLNRIYEKLDEPLQDFVVQQLEVLLWAQGKFYKNKGNEQNPPQQEKNVMSDDFIDRVRPFQRFSMFLEGKRKNSPDT